MAIDLVARLKLVDNLTAPLKRAVSSTKSMSAQINQSNKHLEHFNKTQKQLITHADHAAKSIKNVGHSAHGSSNGIWSMYKGMLKMTAAMGLMAATTAPIIAVGSSMNKAMDFESQLSSIQALTGASNAEMKQMSQLALDMGAKTKYSALQAAQGIEELLKAGLTPATVKAGGLEAALNLATAGELELADAAEIMSTALNAYKRDALTATQASNILAGTANASATSVQELRYGLAQVSAVASGIGMSFKDTNIALGLFANNGLKGSDAGTSLKTMLSNLQPTTKAQIKLFERLGIITESGANQFYNAKGRIKDLNSIADILHKSLAKMTDQQRQLALETMFGSDAVRAATILYKEGADGVKKFQKEMSKVTALEVARKKMDNAAGAVEQFKGAIETLQISAMMPFLPIVKKIANGAADISTKITPSIVQSMERLAKSVQGFFDELEHDDAFKKMTWDEKFVYAADKAMDKLSAWMNSSGGQKLDRVLGKTADIAARAGVVMVEGMAKSTMAAIANSPILALLLGAYIGASVPGPIQLKAILALTIAASPYVLGLIDYLRGYKPQGNVDLFYNVDKKLAEVKKKTASKAYSADSLLDEKLMLKNGDRYKPHTQTDASKVPLYGGSNAALVPMDNTSFTDKITRYLERKGLLPGKSEPSPLTGKVSYAPTPKTNTNNFNIKIASMNVREEKDIDEVAKALAREINARLA